MKKSLTYGGFWCNLFKILRIMRLSLFMIALSATMAFSSVTYSQSTKLTLDLNNVQVKDALKAIENQSEFLFFYQKKHVDLNREVSIHATDQNIEEILNQLFAGTDNAYVINDRQIIIAKLSKEELKGKTFNLYSQEVIKELAYQQPNIIRGKVTDPENKPLPGATITVVGTTRGVITDNDGSFSIEANPSDKLVFSFIGFESQITDIRDQKTINVKMAEKIDELEEVTVVAFGKQKKESVIGSISTIKPEELKVASSNLTTALAGKIAGIIAYQRSGEPGFDNAEFFVRGVTTFGYKKDPLILIDGIELTATDLARLQPDDIASFSIMKDATATALYGARGANGVILVTTKEGVEGKLKVSFRAEQLFSSPTQEIKLADPVTYMKLSNEAIQTRDPLGVIRYGDEKIANTNENANPYIFPATDWHKELLKDYAHNQQYNLNVSGGGNIARYYVAGSYSKDEGILKVDKRNNFNNNINLQKYTLRGNMNISLTKTTEMLVRLAGHFDDYTGPIDGGSGMYNKIMHTNPVLFPPFYPNDEKHKYTSHIMFGNYLDGNYVNPYADMVKGYMEYSRSKMIAQLELHENLEWITQGLSFRTMMNTMRDSYFSVSRFYNPFFYGLSTWDAGKNEYEIAILNENQGTEYLNYREGDKLISSDFYLESALNYNQQFDKHQVSGLLISIVKHNLQGNAGDLQLSLPYRNMGLSGRFTYGYNERYLIEFNFGYNGSERFHKKNRFGFFPSVGLAWNVSNETFWEPYKDVFSKLRIRGSYGLVGNDAIGSPRDRFFYLSNVNMDDSGRSAVFGRDWAYRRNGVSISRYGNDDITWEIAKKSNLALEVDLFDKKVEIISEIFNEYRSNIFMPRASIPVTMGLSTGVSSNVGEASGQGLDFSIDYNQFWGNNIWLTMRGNFTYATSKYEVYEEPQYDEPWRSRVGYSLGQTYGFIAERLFIDDQEVENSPTQHFGEYSAGDIKYLDLNRDGQITDADKLPIGYPTTPEIVYGFGFSLGFYNFDFSSFFQGLANESFWINPVSTFPFYNETQILKAYADSHWSEDNRDLYASWPRLSSTINNNNTQTSTWFMRDGAFLRLKEIELGYTLPKNLQDKIGTSKFRCYLSAINPIIFSKFKLWDVEMGGNGLGYPIQKTFNVGVQISL